MLFLWPNSVPKNDVLFFLTETELREKAMQLNIWIKANWTFEQLRLAVYQALFLQRINNNVK
jgi:hypothetical protein